MLPASNMKIVTAVNVLSTMGADARFTTHARR
jgi:D-alanyl-D-alanine carboxypeptidase